MNFAIFQLFDFWEKSTLGKKTGYFCTFALSGLFHLLKIVQACTSAKKFCAGLLIYSLPPFLQ